VADSRRTPPRGPRPRSRPGSGRAGGGRGARPPVAPLAAAAEGRRRPRFTGRAAILVLVVAVLTVSYASSMRAYLQQRAHISDLKATIAEREASIDDLEREKRRWHDPAYVQAQARERFGYVMPGETSYVVLGEDGKPLTGQTELPTPSEALKQAPEPWFDTAWESVVLAGHPPRDEPPAATDIDAPEEPEQ
jgi:cell division protein FtsB